MKKIRFEEQDTDFINYKDINFDYQIVIGIDRYNNLAITINNEGDIVSCLSGNTIVSGDIQEYLKCRCKGLRVFEAEEEANEYLYELLVNIIKGR